MNRELVSLALSQIEDGLIAEAMTYRGKMRGHAPERKHLMKTHSAGQTGKKIAVLALAAALLLALTATAYAANLLGLRELFRTPYRELPEEAVVLIEQQDERVTGDGWSARVTETLCDASTVLVTVTVDGGDRYLIAPTDAMPEDPLWVIGREGEETLGGYAEQTGKTLLFVGAALPRDEAGLLQQSQRAENLSDSEMVILLSAGKNTSDPSLGTVCTVYARKDGSEEIQRLEIPFTMTEGASREPGIFSPDDPDAIPCLRVGDAVLTETALGITVSIPMTVTDPTAFAEFMSLEFDQLTTHEGSFGEGGAHYTMCEGAVTDTLTARFYGWDKQPLGELIFHKK